MDEVLIFWILKKNGASRGYILTPEQWMELIPFSEKEMEKKFNDWLNKNAAKINL